jgi:hypothetical protein
VTKNKTLLIAVVATAAAMAAFWFLALAPKREEAAALEAQIAVKETELATAQATLAGYTKSKDNYGKNYATVVRLGKAVPEDDDVRSLVVQIDRAAGRSGVDFRTIEVGTGTGGGGGTPTTPPANGTAASAASAATLPPGASVGPAGFPTMPFTFKFEGDFFRMERMFSSIERFTSTMPSGEDVDVLGRLVTVDGFALVASRIHGFPRVHASVAATAYVLPPGEGAFGAAADAAPGAAGSGQTAAAPAGTGKPVTATATATAGVTP